MPRPYPPEVRRRALDLVASGRTFRDVAASLHRPVAGLRALLCVQAYLGGQLPGLGFAIHWPTTAGSAPLSLGTCGLGYG